MGKANILIVGDANIDIVVNGLNELPQMGTEVFVQDMGLCVGGSAANTAVRLAALGSKTDMYCRLADDFLGGYIMSVFEYAHVGTGRIQVEKGRRSGISIGVSTSEDRFFISYKGTNALLESIPIPKAVLSEYAHVHFSLFYGEGLLQTYLCAARLAKECGCTTSLDLGWTDLDEHLDTLFELLGYIDIFFPNDNESKYLCGCDTLKEAVQKLTRHVKGTVVVTMGAQGAYAFDSGRIYKCRYDVDAVDAVGAGDAFDAGFLHGLMSGRGIAGALECGSACGALTVSALGSTNADICADKVDEFIACQARGAFEISEI